MHYDKSLVNQARTLAEWRINVEPLLYDMRHGDRARYLAWAFAEKRGNT